MAKSSSNKSWCRRRHLKKKNPVSVCYLCLCALFAVFKLGSLGIVTFDLACTELTPRSPACKPIKICLIQRTLLKHWNVLHDQKGRQTIIMYQLYAISFTSWTLKLTSLETLCKKGVWCFRWETYFVN